MSNVYRTAAKLVSDSYDLHKGTMRGRKYLGVEKFSDYCYCTMGAVLEAEGRLDEYIKSDRNENDEAWFEALMKPVADEVNAESTYLPFSTIYMWNDAEETTKQDVVDLLNRVADKVDAEQ